MQMGEKAVISDERYF